MQSSSGYDKTCTDEGHIHDQSMRMTRRPAGHELAQVVAPEHILLQTLHLRLGVGLAAWLARDPLHLRKVNSLPASWPRTHHDLLVLPSHNTGLAVSSADLYGGPYKNKDEGAVMGRSARGQCTYCLCIKAGLLELPQRFRTGQG